MLRGVHGAPWFTVALAGFLTMVIAGSATVGLSSCAGRSVLEDPPDGGDELDLDAALDDAALPAAPRSDKLDLLLVVDNSRGLDLAQSLLADSLPYLMDRLTKPACVNGLGNVVATTKTLDEPCPTGVRDFAPLTDIHVAVISTSLGGHGADVCSPQGASWDPAQNDAAHLLNRSSGAATVPTYAEKGFLAWDPAQALDPPGDADLAGFTSKLSEIVRGAGNFGCGYESQLESIYRFLIEPNPYASITIEDTQAVLSGTDDVLLKQRADFLRPGSAVAVVLMTDENDCSTREGGQYYLSNQSIAANGAPFHLPRARSECAANPDDPCCASCAQAEPSGCPLSMLDPACQLPPMDSSEDPINLRCFNQKRRFGLDFLYPVDRYVNGLTKPFVADRTGEIVENPLFQGGRDPRLVFFAGVVGVPWQDIAADPKVLGTGFLPALQIDWYMLLGDPAFGEAPYDPLMIESIEPRVGDNPALGAPLAPPTAGSMENPINGHERTITSKDDLQNACIYARPLPKDCAANPESCECIGDNTAFNPVCQSPDGTYSSVQRYARALPGTRVLATLQQLGAQAVVGSICAAVTSDSSQATFGYKPAINALLRTLRHGLREAEPTNKSP